MINIKNLLFCILLANCTYQEDVRNLNYNNNINTHSITRTGPSFLKSLLATTFLFTTNASTYLRYQHSNFSFDETLSINGFRDTCASNFISKNEKELYRSLKKFQLELLSTDKEYIKSKGKYIPLSGRSDPLDINSFDIDTRIDFFLQDRCDENYLLIMGDGTSGKTILLKTITEKYLQDGSNILPIYIDLKMFNYFDYHSNFLDTYFANGAFLQFSAQDICTLKDKFKLLLLFDHYDWLDHPINLYEEEKAASYNAKVIVTSRPDFIDRVYMMNYFRYYTNTASVIYINNLHNDEVSRFISNYYADRFAENNGDQGELLYQFYSKVRSFGIEETTFTPFFLRELLNFVYAQETITPYNSNQYLINAWFIHQYRNSPEFMFRHERSNIEEIVNKIHNNSQDQLLGFKKVATAIYITKDLDIRMSGPTSDPNLDLSMLFYKENHHIRIGLPLKIVGRDRFRIQHSSFVEFILANIYLENIIFLGHPNEDLLSYNMLKNVILDLEYRIIDYIIEGINLKAKNKYLFINHLLSFYHPHYDKRDPISVNANNILDYYLMTYPSEIYLGDTLDRNRNTENRHNVSIIHDKLLRSKVMSSLFVMINTNERINLLKTYIVLSNDELYNETVLFKNLETFMMINLDFIHIG